MLDLQTITTGIISCKLLRQGLFLASYYDKDYFLQAITMEIISWKQWRRMLFLGSHNDEDYFLETITMKVISCKPLRRKMISCKPLRQRLFLIWKFKKYTTFNCAATRSCTFQNEQRMILYFYFRMAVSIFI